MKRLSMISLATSWGRHSCLSRAAVRCHANAPGENRPRNTASDDRQECLPHLYRSLLSCLLALALISHRLRAKEPDVGDGTRVSGTVTFACTPDEKSKNAGATAFEDTLELGDDRVKSKVLTAEGFPVALSIPKMVNGVPTFNASFKKPGATATYFIRVKDGGTVSGSLTRMQGGKTVRYTIGTAGGGDGAKGEDGA